MIQIELAFYLVGALSLFGLISLIRYFIIWHLIDEKTLQKINFPAYNISNFLIKLRNKSNFVKSGSFPVEQNKQSLVKNQTLPAEKTKLLPAKGPLSSQMEQSRSSATKGQPLPKTESTTDKNSAIIDSIWSGVNTIRQYMCIDDNIYEGVSRLSGEQIDSFSDLSAKLTTYAHDFQGLTTGALNKVKGHIAESHIAEHFKDAGIDVQWPPVSNQEGWDLLLNGQPVQVKLTQNANNLVEHFSKHSEIPVVIPSDAENIPDVAFHFNGSDSVDHLWNYLTNTPENPVIVDHQLSHEHLSEQVESGTDLAVGSVDFDFPWITATCSGWREINLLMEGDTNIVSALKNAGLDVAGTGIGMTAGSTLGAGIGTVILPGIGTVVGSILGNFTGSFVGRSLTNEIKQKPLKQAMKNMKDKYNLLKKECKKAQTKYQIQLQSDEESAQLVLNQESNLIKRRIAHHLNILRKWIIDKETPSENLKRRLLNNIPKAVRMKWFEYFWPKRKTIFYRKKLKQYQYFFKNRFFNQDYIDRGQLFQELSQRGLCRQLILSEIKKSEKMRQKKEKQILFYITKNQTDLLKMRQSCFKRLANRLIEYTHRIREELSSYIQDIQDSQKIVIEETKKLGVNRQFTKRSA